MTLTQKEIQDAFLDPRNGSDEQLREIGFDPEIVRAAQKNFIKYGNITLKGDNKMTNEMNEKPREAASMKAVFEKPQTAIDPALKDKIEAAFVTVEDLLKEAFPSSRKLSLVLTYLEIAAMYVLQLM